MLLIDTMLAINKAIRLHNISSPFQIHCVSKLSDYDHIKVDILFI